MIERSKPWTRKYPERVFALDVPVGVSIPFIGQQEKSLATEPFRFLWDTGSTCSVITPRVVEMLDLIPIDKTIAHTPNGSAEKSVYLVNFFLPNNTLIEGVRVVEADLVSQGIDGLIGMDIIGTGDFAITHADGATVVTFRTPSCQEVDYVKERHERLNTEISNH